MAVKSKWAAPAAILALLANAGQAQQLPTPSLPLTGAEWFQCWQAHKAKGCTPAEVAGYLLGQPNTFGPLQTFGGDLALPTLAAHGVLLGEGGSGLNAVPLAQGQALVGQATGDPLATTIPLLSTPNSYAQTQTFPAAGAAGPSFIAPPGSAPTSPPNGSFWTTASGAYAEVNGQAVALGTTLTGPGASLGTSGAVLCLLNAGCNFGAGTTAPTQSAGDNSTKLATTAYVDRTLTKYSAASIGVLTTNTAAQNTTAINAELSALATGAGGEIDFPCGTFPLQNITIPAGNGPVTLHGAGRGCTFLQQDAADLANNLISINATGAVNGTQWPKVENLTLTATAQKTGGALIYGKGVAMPTFTDLIMLNAYNGFVLDGIDRIIFQDVQIWNPSIDGYQLYDGFDCGFTPVTTTSTSAINAGSTTSFTVNSGTGISAGMNVEDASVGGNFTLGTVQSVVGTTVTLTAPAPQAAAGGHTLVFGGDCGGTAILWAKDNWVSGAGRFGVNLAGGVGGVISQGLEILNDASDAFNTNTSLSHGVSNREIFFTGADSAFDSNTGADLNITTGSVGKVIADGAWFNASSGNFAVAIGLQRAQVNPVESGAIIRFTGSTIGQSSSGGLYYVDQGTLLMTGNDLSYSYGSGANGITIQTNTGVGHVVITNNMVHNNNGYAIKVLGTQPPFLNITNNDVQGGASGSITGFVIGGSAVCTGNIGNGTLAAGC